jgi:hypothetical protein
MAKKTPARRQATRAKAKSKRAPAQAKGSHWAEATGTPLLDHIEFNFVPYFVALTVVLLGLQLVVRKDRADDARSPASMSERPGAAQLRDAEPLLREDRAWAPSRK